MSKRLLIVDGDPEMLLSLSTLIREMTPYEATITNNPLEAVEIIRQGMADLVISEVKMPVKDGIELLDEVRRTDEDIPVILMSSYGQMDLALEARRKGCFEFVTVPFRKDRMLYAIDNALKWSSLKKENRALREQLKASYDSAFDRVGT